MKLGIALSGGGVKGIAHAGVLKALEDNGIQIDIIGGTSSGSIIASIYAMGYSPYYTYILFKRYVKEVVEITPFPIMLGIKNFMMNKKSNMLGLKSGEELEEAYDKIGMRYGKIKITDINKVKIVIPAVDIHNGKEYIFTNNIPDDEKIKGDILRTQYITDISIGKAVRASSSFPSIFTPCEYKKQHFLDGGILDNIPILEVKKQGADKVIAVQFETDDIDEKSNLIDIGMRTIFIMGDKISKESLNKSDYIITIDTPKMGLLDTDNIEECYKAGYSAVIRNLKEIKNMLELTN